ncbi:MAG: MFS transporter [Spirochaetales bacterium]|nr:MFS transporter [Spirochaetales bacterium]
MDRLQDIYRQDSRYRQLIASLMTIGLAYGLYKGVLDNYLAEIVNMGEFDRGLTEFFRELPGFLLIFILALIYRFSVDQIYRIGSLIMIIGMGMISVVPAQRVLVTIAICTFSLGEHIQLGMKNTLSLEYAQPGKGGAALGIQQSIYNAGNILGYIIIAISFIFLSGESSFRLFFIASTIILCISMIPTMGISSNSRTDATKRRFYFRKKYYKFYMLEVFYGARKQIFFTFGPYVLILFYKANASVIALLFTISAISCAILSPVVGKIIDRLGYKIVMISDTLILVIVCFFYGFAHHIFPMNIAFVICCINYILDSVISLASMASNVYVQDISDNGEEVRATVTTGISVNHLITILIALFGGWIWKVLGIETLFSLSAILGLCNSAYAATIKTSRDLKRSAQKA